MRQKKKTTKPKGDIIYLHPYELILLGNFGAMLNLSKPSQRNEIEKRLAQCLELAKKRSKDVDVRKISPILRAMAAIRMDEPVVRWFSEGHARIAKEVMRRTEKFFHLNLIKREAETSWKQMQKENDR